MSKSKKSNICSTTRYNWLEIHSHWCLPILQLQQLKNVGLLAIAVGKIAVVCKTQINIKFNIKSRWNHLQNYCGVKLDWIGLLFVGSRLFDNPSPRPQSERILQVVIILISTIHNCSNSFIVRPPLRIYFVNPIFRFFCPLENHVPAVSRNREVATLHSFFNSHFGSSCVMCKQDNKNLRRTIKNNCSVSKNISTQLTSAALAALLCWAWRRPLMTSMKLWWVWVGSALRRPYRPKLVPRGIDSAKVTVAASWKIFKPW